MRFIIPLLLIGLNSLAQVSSGNKTVFMNTTTSATVSAGGGGGGGATAPIFIAQTETVWNVSTTPKTTGSISVNNGDILVAFGVIEGQATSSSDHITVTGGSLTWTEQQAIRVGSFTYVGVYTATANATTSITVSFDHDAGGNMSLIFGGSVFVFRNSNGIGASAKTNNASGAPTLSLTTTQANSAIVEYSGDWDGGDGTSRVWNTVNSITPSVGNSLDRTYFRDASAYTVYGSYWNDVGAIGAKTLGLSSPTGQKYSIVAIEVKGL